MDEHDEGGETHVEFYTEGNKTGEFYVRRASNIDSNYARNMSISPDRSRMHPENEGLDR